MLRVLVFVTFIAWTRAGDGGFAPFCKEFLNGRLEDKNRRCEKDIDLVGVPAGSAEALCQHWSRFAVLSANAESDKLRCSWNITGICEEGHYILDNCYKLLSTCTGDWKLFPLSDGPAFRWVVLTFPGEQVAKVRIPTRNKQPTVKYSRGQLLPLAAGENPKERAVIFSRMPVFDGYPGKVVYLQEGDGEEPVNSVCRKNAVGGPQFHKRVSVPCGLKGKIEKHESGAFGGRTIKASNGAFTLLLTRNVYSPRVDSKGQIDLNYFHEICETLCDGCYAATPDYLDSAKLTSGLGKGKFWLPGRQNPVTATNDCQGKPPRGPEFNNWFIFYHRRHPKEYILPTKYWKTGLPNELCSDEGRYAMAYQNGKVVDVPIFDRLPLVCVYGQDPPIPQGNSNCLKNSESDGKNSCKCRNGFKDITDPETMKGQEQAIVNYIQSLAVTPGYVCVRATCDEGYQPDVPIYESILFVIDGSHSINFACKHNHCPDHFIGDNFQLMRDFIYDAGKWLPKASRIFFLQYSTDVSGGYARLRSNTIAPWDEQHYKTIAQQTMYQYLDGSTPTYEAIQEMTNWWLSYNPQPRKAVMIIITDGSPNPYGATYQRADILAYARSNGIDIKYVAVGIFDRTHMEGDILDKNKDIAHMAAYTDMKEGLKEKIVPFLKCASITEEQINDAMNLAYSKRSIG